MLATGALRRPIDIADLVLHGTPPTLLVWKVDTDLLTRRTPRESTF
jgi:hypothetical protein